MMIGKTINDINAQMPYDAYTQGKDQPTFKAYLTIIVADKKGDIVKIHKQWSHSPTFNFIVLLLPTNWYTNTGSALTITNTNGYSYKWYTGFCNTCYSIYYPTNQRNYPAYLVMIQVGSGQRSIPYNAYSLAAPIANGSGTGQLLYGQPSVSQTPIVSGSSAYFIISQTLNNQSGGTVVITELGIIVNIGTWNISTGSYQNLGNFLVWYDVLGSPISVPNGGSITIYYTFAVNP
jgi:hypothetical protein